MPASFHSLLGRVKPNCADKPESWWFADPDDDEELGEEYVIKAKQICGTCPLIATCREYGIEQQEPYGIFGGMTPQERRKELKVRNRQRLSA